MKRVFVTGGTGLVGRFTVEALRAGGWKVIIAGRNWPDTRFPSDVGFRPLDLGPAEDFGGLLTGFDALVHAAFDRVPGRYRGGEGRDVKGFWDRNYMATLHLFEAAAAAGLERVVFLSSRAVYGRQPAGAVVTEETLCHPDTHYGLVKAAAEEHLAGMSAVCGVSLRPTGVYGQPPYGGTHKWSELFEAYLAGQPIEPRFGTEVHGHDVAAAIQLVLEAPTESVAGESFNVSDLELDRRDLLTLVQDQTGCKHPLPPVADRSRYNLADTARLRDLGWHPGGNALLHKEVSAVVGSI